VADVAEVVGSPEWLRRRMAEALDKQRQRVLLLERYADGDHPLPTPPRAMNEDVWQETKRAFLSLSQLGRTNWVKLISRAPAERLRVRGFRFGDATTPDANANKLWQENGLDGESPVLHQTVFDTGQAYSLVWPGEKEGTADITYEHPGQMIVMYEAGSRRRRRAAFKQWIDEDGRFCCNLYTPKYVYKWQTRNKVNGFGIALGSGEVGWIPREVRNEQWPLPNPMEKVPVVEFAVNTGLRARPYGGGVSEFQTVLSIQDRINKTIFDRLVTAESQAFRQRYTIGWDPPIDPKTNKPDRRAVLELSQSKFITLPGGEKDGQQVQVGELDQADFKSFIDAVENDVNAMAAITQTPPHYLLGAMVNIAAEAFAAAEAGLVSKTKGHAEVIGEAHEETIRLGLKAAKQAGYDDQQSATIWEDIERRSWAEKIDGLIKLKSLGVPEHELWAKVDGVTPQDVERWKNDASSGTDDEAKTLSLVEQIQKIYLGVGTVIDTAEAREILNRGGANLTGPGPAPKNVGAPGVPA